MCISTYNHIHIIEHCSKTNQGGGAPVTSKQMTACTSDLSDGSHHTFFLTYICTYIHICIYIYIYIYCHLYIFLCCTCRNGLPLSSSRSLAPSLQQQMGWNDNMNTWSTHTCRQCPMDLWQMSYQSLLRHLCHTVSAGDIRSASHCVLRNFCHQQSRHPLKPLFLSRWTSWQCETVFCHISHISMSAETYSKFFVCTW